MQEDSIKKTIRNCTLDVHPADKAVVVSYELEAVLLNPPLEQTRECQKTIRIKGLGETTDLTALAQEVVAKCHLIPESRTAEVEQLLSYLQDRKEQRSAPSPAKAEPASMTRVESYVEMLYEDTDDKVRGSAMVLELARNPENLSELAANDTLLCALARVLREDGRKNTQLATNLAYVFFCFSTFSQFHPLIAEYKLGSVCVDLVEYELRRHAHWKESRKSDPGSDADRSWRKYQALVRRQDQLLRVCLYLLLNIAEDARNEIKMVNRGLIPMLVDCLQREQTDLLLLVVCFLKKLSIYFENKTEMARLPTIERLVPLVGKAPLNAIVLRLLLNLSFDVELRVTMLREGLLPKLVTCLSAGESTTSALCILYHLSLDDRCKSHFTYTDCVPWLVRTLVGHPEPKVPPEPLALAVNLASNKRNAQLFCDGLAALVGRALSSEDALLMKLVHVISQHEGPTRRAFSAYADTLAAALRRPSADPEFVLECVATLANLDLPGLSELLSRHDLLPWAQQHLNSGPDDLVLQLVGLLGTAARADERCALEILQGGLLDTLTGLLRARQEDDNLVLQV